MRRFATIRAHSFICGLWVFLIIAIASGASGQSALPSPAHSPDQPSSTSERSVAHAVVIGGGDLLKVSILGAPESDQEVRVAEDGNISLSFIGSVHVGGLTTSGAQELIAKKLVAGGFFTDPQVRSSLKSMQPRGCLFWERCKNRVSIPCSALAGCLMCCRLRAGQPPGRKGGQYNSP